MLFPGDPLAVLGSIRFALCVSVYVDLFAGSAGVNETTAVRESSGPSSHQPECKSLYTLIYYACLEQRGVSWESAMKPVRFRILATLAGAVLSCAASAAELTVSAAASLTNAFRELAPMFEAQLPGTKVQWNFGASGALLQQIAKGAPVDVFASADQETMDQAQTQALVKASDRATFASNALVVIVPAQGNTAAKSLSDLAQPAYKRVAIGLPASVPVGWRRPAYGQPSSRG